MDTFQKTLKIIFVVLFLFFMCYGIYSFIFGTSLTSFGSNKVIYFRTQYAQGRVIRIKGNTITLQKDRDSLDIEIPSETVILKQLSEPSLEASPSLQPGDLESEIPLKASFSDIKIGSELNISFKGTSDKLEVESVVIK